MRWHPFLLKIIVTPWLGLALASAWAAPLVKSACPPNVLQRALQFATQAAIGDVAVLRRLPLTRFRALSKSEAGTALSAWTPTANNAYVAISTGSPERALELLRKLPEGTTWGVFDREGEYLVGPARGNAWPKSDQTPAAAVLSRNGHVYEAQLDWTKVTHILIDREVFERRFEAPLRSVGAPKPYAQEAGQALFVSSLVQSKPNPEKAAIFKNLGALAHSPPMNLGHDFILFRDSHSGIYPAARLVQGGEWGVLERIGPKSRKFDTTAALVPLDQSQFAPGQLMLGWRNGSLDLNSGAQRKNLDLDLRVLETGKIFSISTSQGVLSGIVTHLSGDNIEVHTQVTNSSPLMKYAQQPNPDLAPFQKFTIPRTSVLDVIPGWTPDAAWANAGRQVATPEGIKTVQRFEAQDFSPDTIVHFTDGTQQKSEILPRPPSQRAVEFAQIAPKSDKIVLKEWSESESSGGDSWGKNFTRTLIFDSDSSTEDAMVLKMSLKAEGTGWDRTLKEYDSHANGDPMTATGGSLSALVEVLKDRDAPLIWVRALNNGGWHFVMPKGEKADQLVEKLRAQGFRFGSL